MALSFGVTACPDPPYTRFLELIELAEANAEYGWTYDSHVLWHEATPLLTLAADRTTRMKLGHFVTNPGTREPTVLASLYATLHVISGGRMVMGIGRGASGVARRRPPAVKVAEFEAWSRMIGDFANGRKVEWNGKELQLSGRAPTRRSRCTWPATPKALAVAGPHRRRRDHPARRPGDHRVDHGHRARVGREGRPRPGRSSKSASSARRRRSPTTSRRRARRCAGSPPWSRPRHGPPIERYGWDSEIPSELTDFVKTRKGYDYKDHSRVGAAHGEFVSDEICDRFCVIGSAEQCTAKLRELQGVGVNQFNIYLMTNGQEEVLEAYGRGIIPELAGVAA
jgi:alkanesulfonate monooxygenase SsuD/methylene tetrahydromethanopterin reductase-like flavin-dependent oxidoreductase (luciferase family)